MSLVEYRKAAVAGVIALLALAAFFVTFDPGAQDAAVATTIAVFNVAAVLLAKNQTVDDVSKAVAALQASSLALVSFFITVDPSTDESVGAAAIAVVNVYAIWRAVNKPAIK